MGVIGLIFVALYGKQNVEVKVLSMEQSVGAMKLPALWPFAERLCIL